MKLSHLIYSLSLSAGVICLPMEGMAKPYTPAKTENSNTKAASVQEIINLNQADLATLMKLPGIGKQKARAILKHRELKGRFKTLKDLIQIKGINKRILAKLNDKVRV